MKYSNWVFIALIGFLFVSYMALIAVPMRFNLQLAKNTDSLKALGTLHDSIKFLKNLLDSCEKPRSFHRKIDTAKAITSSISETSHVTAAIVTSCKDSILVLSPFSGYSVVVDRKLVINSLENELYCVTVRQSDGRPFEVMMTDTSVYKCAKQLQKLLEVKTGVSPKIVKAYQDILPFRLAVTI